ncbi:MAG: OHCU decarboxylase [Deltaproteobacteria bacterium]|nr:OHCU decarboxylase [Deltaproteobacteria bacterium]
MIVEYLYSLSQEERRKALLLCCGSTRWVDGMSQAFPFSGDEDLHKKADEVWNSLQKEDFLEAFTHHPQIGASKEHLRKKFQNTASWSSGEQAGVSQASEKILDRLVHGNKAYLDRFGYIFIVCATGKSAKEMVEILEQRLPNEPEIELRIAAREQAKITHIRLEKLGS